MNKGMQMVLVQTLRMLLPPEVMAVLTAERVEGFVGNAEKLVEEYREKIEVLRSTQENILDELASISARLDGITKVDGNPKRPGKHNSSSESTGSEPGTDSGSSGE